VLAAVAGAPAAQRTQASFAVNLTQGGDAGQITVISRYAAEDPRSQRFGADLQRRVDAFTHATGTQAAIGGPAGQLGDFRSETASRIWPVVAGVSIVILLLIMALLRAVVLPLVAVAFDLLTAGATLGIVALLFSGGDRPLGGLGYLDPMTIIAAFATIFAMTMLYEVQLLARTRELFVARGDAKVAIGGGLHRTAAAATGAAVAMIAAIVPFATSDLVMVRQLGVAAGTAILLDALVVRPVLLPAAAELLGDRSWWPTRPAPPAPPAVPPQPAAPERVPAGSAS
jgi:putative drug exporter of the RND superfamily